jgi:hypothetical protein
VLFVMPKSKRGLLLKMTNLSQSQVQLLFTKRKLKIESKMSFTPIRKSLSKLNLLLASNL